MTMPIVRSNLPKTWKICITQSICTMANSCPNFDLHLRNNADTDCFDHNYSDLFSTSYYVALLCRPRLLVTTSYYVGPD